MLRFAIVAALFALAAAQTRPPREFCFEGRYNQIFDACLSYQIRPRNWADAEEQCEEFNGHLVHINDGFENNIIVDGALDEFGDEEYFIGAYRGGNNTWFWTDGSRVSYNKWDRREPRDGDCAISTRTGKWRSVECTERLPHICIYPASEFTGRPSRGTRGTRPTGFPTRASDAPPFSIDP